MKKWIIYIIIFILSISLVKGLLTDDLISYHSFDADGLDNHSIYNMTLSGATISTSSFCKLGKCLDMDGASDCAYSDNSVFQVGTGDFSIAFWGHWDVMAGNMIRNFQMYLDYSAPNVRYWNAVNTNTVDTGDINHYVLLRNNSDAGGAVSLFINGSYIGGGTRANDLNAISYVVGASSNACINELDGQVDELGFWNRTLTNAEIAELYNSGAGLAYPFTGTPPTSAFEVTVSNENNFNLTINGSTYITTNGTVVTNISNADSPLYNFTIYGFEYFERNVTNYNISSDLTTTLIKYPYIKVVDSFTGLNVSNYNITVNGTLYDNKSNNLYIRNNATIWANFDKEDFPSLNITSYELISDSFLQINVTQTLTWIRATEINTGNYINNFSITIKYGIFNTTNGTIVITPPFDTYNLNFTTNDTYINVSNLNLTVDENVENLTISNLYARNISFIDNISLVSLTPTCIQSGYTYNTYPYSLPKDTSNISCTLFSYRSLDISNTNLVDIHTYSMNPVSLSMNFSQNTSGVIQSGDEYILSFNASYVFIYQYNVTEGYVKVSFNPTAGKYQQIFSYYNDLNTTIKENLMVQDIDLQQSVRVTGNTQPIIGARVCAYYHINDTYYITYCDFTDSSGDVIINVYDENTYKFCAQADGYIPNCDLYYIPASNQERITMELVSSNADEGYNYISSNCMGSYINSSSCLLEVVTYKPFYSICVNTTTTVGNTSNETQTCAYDSASESFLYSISVTENSKSLRVFLDGIYAGQIYHLNSSYNPDVKIQLDSGNINGSSIQDYLFDPDNTVLLVAIHIIMLGLGILSGFMFEKYYKGYGVYGTGVWFMFMGFMKLYIFWIPAVVIFINFILKVIVPMIEN